MKTKKIIGLIVTYFPKKSHIENIKKHAKLVDELYVFDNSCNKAIKKELNSISIKEKLKIFFNEKNYGIGISANRFFKKIHTKTEWCILLDQDSILTANLYRLIKSLKKNNIDIAGLNFSEQKPNLNFPKKIKFEKARRIIFSGTLMNKKIFQLYQFPEEYFLDMTDFAFSKKLIDNKIDIIKIKNLAFQHHVGEASLCKFLFFRKNRTNHPPINTFLMARNRILLSRKKEYKLSVKKIILKQIKEIILTMLFEKNAYQKILARIQGIKHGLVNTRFESIEDIEKILKKAGRLPAF